MTNNIDRPLRAAVEQVLRDELEPHRQRGRLMNVAWICATLQTALSAAPDDVPPDTSAIARVVADMREHQDHVQMGGRIRRWCDALAGAPAKAEHKHDTYHVTPEGEQWVATCTDCGARFPFLPKAPHPSPGTIAVADVAAVLADLKRNVSEGGTLYQIGYRNCNERVRKQLQALITAGEQEQWVTCEPCKGMGKGRTIEIATGKQVGDVCVYCCGRGEVPVDELEPQVPLAAAFMQVMDADCSDCTFCKEQDWRVCTVDTCRANAKAALAPYRPAAKEPCATCGGARRLECSHCCGRGWIEFIHNTDDRFPDRDDCKECEGKGSTPCPDCTPPQEPDTTVIMEPHTAILDTKLKPTPLSTAQRAAWFWQKASYHCESFDDVVNAFENLGQVLAGQADDTVLKWLQAQDEEGGDGN